MKLHGSALQVCRIFAIVSLGALTLSIPAAAQAVLRSSNGIANLGGADLSVFEARENRRDLTCTVTPVKPAMGFDLRFHAGYEFSLPLKELAGSDNLLTVVFRVTPDAKDAQPTYFTQKFRVPSIDPEAKGDVYLQGAFDVGEGKYKVDWLVRDRAEQYCAHFWEAEADVPPKDKSLVLELPPGRVEPSPNDQFMDEPPVERESGAAPVNVKVLVNFAPQNSLSASLQPMDTIAMTTMLRQIQREPRIGRFSVVAFNLQEQRILYRQDALDRIDMPALGEAVKNIQLGKVSVDQLANKHAETEFLSDLIKNEFSGAERPDALIFAGPRAAVTEKLPDESLKTVGELDYPVFYVNYTLNPQLNPWRDSIGQAVRFFRGQEYVVSRPRDLWFAVSEMVNRIVKSKAGKKAASAAFK